MDGEGKSNSIEFRSRGFVKRCNGGRDDFSLLRKEILKFSLKIMQRALKNKSK